MDLHLVDSLGWMCELCWDRAFVYSHNHRPKSCAWMTNHLIHLCWCALVLPLLKVPRSRVGQARKDSAKTPAVATSPLSTPQTKENKDSLFCGPHCPRLFHARIGLTNHHWNQRRAYISPPKTHTHINNHVRSKMSWWSSLLPTDEWYWRL